MKKIALGTAIIVAALVITGCTNKNKQNNKVMQEQTIQKDSNLLLIVDPQVDFTTGSLAVAKGCEAMDQLAKCIENGLAGNYSRILVTQDFHPGNHCSFTENGGTWPVHCMQGTEGVEIYPVLRKALDNVTDIKVEYLHKGDIADREEYSILQNEESSKYIKELVGNSNFAHIDICGIASDYCVFETLRDLIGIYPAGQTRIAMDCVASVSDDDKLPAFMGENNVEAVMFGK